MFGPILLVGRLYTSRSIHELFERSFEFIGRMVEGQFCFGILSKLLLYCLLGGNNGSEKDLRTIHKRERHINTEKWFTPLSSYRPSGGKHDIDGEMETTEVQNREGTINHKVE